MSSNIHVNIAEMTIDELNANARHIEDQQKSINESIRWLNDEQEQMLRVRDQAVDHSNSGEVDAGEGVSLDDLNKMIESINLKVNNIDCIVSMLQTLMQKNEVTMRVLVQHTIEAITLGNELEQQWALPPASK